VVCSGMDRIAVGRLGVGKKREAWLGMVGIGQVRTGRARYGASER
jgi:hypothetical protein